jgi:RHS repeat-associated protein
MTSCTYQGDTTTYTYGYDGLRRSSTKDSVTTNYVYDGTNLVAEMKANASGTLVTTTTYLLGSQGIEAKIDETSQTEAYYELNPTTGARLFDANNNLIVAYRGVTSWYIYDGHGNVVGTVNGVTGAFTANPTLDVYGVPRASGAAAMKQGYCGSLGHVTDDTGLVYMRARYYDPNVGRFVSEDPGANGNNWYVYASDNPVNMADKDGKKATNLGALFAVIGAVLAIIGAILLCLAIPEVATVVTGIALTNLSTGVVLDACMAALATIGLNIAGTAILGTLSAILGAVSLLISYFCDAGSDSDDESPSPSQDTGLTFV